jgi:uncharacterized protein YrrD
MLWRVRELLGCAIGATDGTLGRIHDVYFDDQQWVVRYLAAETGHWLTGRRVLLSPLSVRRINWSYRWVAVALSRQQVRNSPAVDTQKPIERQHESPLLEYYGLRHYWMADRPWGGIVGPVGVKPIPRSGALGGAATEAEPGDRHLHSARMVIGYTVYAADGEVGCVEDFLVDDHTWTVRYLVLDSRHWWPGRRVLAAERIGRVSWMELGVHVELDRDTIRQAPEYDPARPIDRAYEARLHDHYGQPPRWSPGRPAA